MSHELRTPMQAIIGFSEMMVDERFGPMPERYQRMAQTVLNSSLHLLQLINDVLDFSKVESGRTEFRPEPIHLPALVSEVRSIVKALAAENHVAIETSVDPEIGVVHLDPGKLKQVLYNYLSNAIKFSRDGGRVDVRLVPDGSDAFRIEVEDHGIGIPEHQHGKLFVEFQQLDSSTTKRYPGTGLGLALTKRIVEAQGGSVGFRSREGEGSTFFAVLPRRSDTRSAELTAGADAGARSPAAPEC
jgi:signal transduction histidine kinase